MLAPVTHINPLTLIRRERISPIPGKVLVRQGQTVKASDTVVEANLSPAHLLVDVTRGLGVAATKADQYIACKAGLAVEKGDVLAGPVGVSRRVLRAPRDGTVVVAGGGQILLDVTDTVQPVKAGIPGEVTELVPKKGVVIETIGALIQGVWGNGAVDFGLLSLVARAPDHVLTPDQLEVSLRGSVALAAYCEDPEALQAAEDLPLRGLILSSIPPALIPYAQKVKIPIIVLEGFGKRPMNSAAFKLLTTNDRREVAVNAQPWDRYSGERPEIVIQLPGSIGTAPPLDSELFSVGQTVRILRSPELGATGQISKILGPVTFPSGLIIEAAQVRLENGEEVILPLTNMDVLA